MITDRIADMLTRIRNAQGAGHDVVRLAYSRVRHSVAEILVQERFLESVSVERIDDAHSDLVLRLRYRIISPTHRDPVISHIGRVSRPGQRRYVRAADIHPIRNGYGVSVVSTSRGVMTGAAARKKGVGGEVICEVW
ncbi:MAG: 30S ribosomal protein S8 [Candidatus Moranbacteria bacterium]|nr:30S ribosomal protein S8 [Candidatus Moranbacteria bacterium]